ncbi:MAG: phosphonate metabolism transcriptional regulator PhnF [Paracoccus sp. (in: a-proteobacteria)]|nr:phosphonate metabolism transcriptional regulator PhnF [Paracoccus sp. (in: a-proteobacteria)]
MGEVSVTEKRQSKNRTPLWQAIRDAIAADMVRQQAVPGDQLPTEAVLAARFGVNRHTVRRALAALAESGMVRARRGAGVFVAMRPVDYHLGGRVRFHRNLELAGRVPGRRFTTITARAASPREAEALDLARPAQIWAAEGVSTADAHPIAAFLSVFPHAMLPRFDEALRRLASVTDALHAAGISDFTRAETRISAASATATQAELLHLREGAPLIVTTSINAAPDGKPVEFGTTFFAAERVTLLMRPD